MPRVTKVIDATTDDVESAKNTIVSLMSNSLPTDALDLFYTNDLQFVESGIKKLNNYANKSWLLSAILLYTLIYDKGLFVQSGLTWYDYSKEARERLGLEPRDITEQLSAARFFIKNREELMRQGFNPDGSSRKLARAEVALDNSGDVHAVIKHLVNDTWIEFKDWYSSFKLKKALPKAEAYREDISIKDNRFYIGKVEAVKISDKIPEADREQIQKYMTQIFETIKQGNVPAIVSVYNEKEARILPRLRDKYRQGK